MNRPSTSVVLIVKDGERFLEEAIESVRGQTLPASELIVVDDGSSDRTAGILEDAASRDPAFVRVLRHPGGANLGMSRSRNLGLAAARGDFVTFLDHDDVMLPRKLESMHETLAPHPDAIAAIGPCRKWRSWEKDGRDEDQDLGAPADRIEPPPGPLIRFLADSSRVPLGPLIRTSCVRAFGGYVETFRGMHEDQAFLTRLVLHGPVVYGSQVHHLYRQHADSCVARTHRAGRDRHARRRFLRWLEEELERHAVDEPELRRLVRRELRTTRGWAWRWLRRSAINLRGQGPTSNPPD